MLNMALHFKFICNLEKTTITIVQTIHLTMFSPSRHITYSYDIKTHFQKLSHTFKPTKLFFLVFYI
jgi:predicted branched-subunit amino acid permease